MAYPLLGFTGNASFVIYHIHTHHRQVGTYDDAATARRGERLRTFMAGTLTQQFAQAARFEAARLKRKGLSPYSRRNELIAAHLVNWQSWRSPGSSAAGREWWLFSSPT